MFFVLFGVKTSDIEIAREWLNEVLPIAAQGRNNEYVGDYYVYGKRGGERVKLCSGISQDEDGKYPTEEEFPDQNVIIYVDQTTVNSTNLRAIESRPDRFVKLREDRSAEEVSVSKAEG